VKWLWRTHPTFAEIVTFRMLESSFTPKRIILTVKADSPYVTSKRMVYIEIRGDIMWTHFEVYGWLLYEHTGTKSSDLEFPETHARQIFPRLADWETAKSWVKYCEANHGTSCQPDPLRLRNFMVIDCYSRQVVLAPENCKYAALSYVWGGSVEGDLDFRLSLPNPAPLAIEDAITCTASLGFSYLWVDRYCIDQESTLKHVQIQNMDQIYGCAAVTLVHSTGKDARSGIPGVTITSRSPQKSVTIGGKSMFFVSSVQKELANSTWQTRGWTFQEGLLSSRRLVLAESQLYYQCLKMHCYESIRRTFNSDSKGDELGEVLRGFNLERIHASPTIFENDSWFDSYLEKFLERQLSYDSDCLNAFMGILRRFWHQKSPIYHFWGMHFICADASDFAKRLFLLPKRASTAVLTKREDFPSWTWAAWNGPVSWKRLQWQDWNPTLDSDTDVTVRVEDESGQLQTLSQYVTRDMYRFRPCLIISGWIATVQFESIHDSTEYFCRTTNVYGSSSRSFLGTAEIMNVHLPEQPAWNWTRLGKGFWPLLLFVNNDTSSLESQGMATGLVLKPAGEGSYMKLGVLHNVEFEPMVRLDQERAQLRRRAWDPSVKLDCERHTIKLV
jgi:hypothetical protein